MSYVKVLRPSLRAPIRSAHPWRDQQWPGINTVWRVEYEGGHYDWQQYEPGGRVWTNGYPRIRQGYSDAVYGSDTAWPIWEVEQTPVGYNNIGPTGWVRRYRSTTTVSAHEVWSHWDWQWDTVTMELLFNPYDKGEAAQTNRQRVWGVDDDFEFQVRKEVDGSPSLYSFNWDCFISGATGAGGSLQLPAGRWYHVVATADARAGAGNPGLWKIWVNGVLMDTNTTGTISIPAADGTMCIGNRGSSQTSTDGFSGKIAYLRLYEGVASNDTAVGMYRQQWQQPRVIGTIATGTTWQGAAALSASGTIAALSAVDRPGVSSVSATGSLAVSGYVILGGIAAVSGTASLTSGGQPVSFARPIQDITLGSWKDEADGTTDIFNSIDESSPSGTDYIYGSDTYETLLTSYSDPTASDYHAVRYVYYKTGDVSATVNLTVRLMQGAVEIASWTHNDIPVTETEAEQYLSAAEADSITDYTDLRLRFEVSTA